MPAVPRVTRSGPSSSVLTGLSTRAPATAGNFNGVDYGQTGATLRRSAEARRDDPPSEGGALRAQDLRTRPTRPGSTARSSASIPATGAALPTTPRGELRPEARRIIAYGMRNPFRFTFRPGTSELWIGDVGWNDWEEIDRILAPTDSTVENFGWPCYEGAERAVGLRRGEPHHLREPLRTAESRHQALLHYQHAAVVSGDTCPTRNGSSVAGLSFEFAPNGSTSPPSTRAHSSSPTTRATASRSWRRTAIRFPRPDRSSPSPGRTSPVNLELAPTATSTTSTSTAARSADRPRQAPPPTTNATSAISPGRR